MQYEEKRRAKSRELPLTPSWEEGELDDLSSLCLHQSSLIPHHSSIIILPSSFLPLHKRIHHRSCRKEDAHVTVEIEECEIDAREISLPQNPCFVDEDRRHRRDAGVEHRAHARKETEECVEENRQRMNRSHAQEMAIRYFTMIGGFGDKSATDALRTMTDWFQRDSWRTAEQVSPKQESEEVF